MMLIRKCFLVLLLPICSNAQTCIIAIRTNDQITIGTDSRRSTFFTTTDIFGRYTEGIKYDTICKEGHIKNIYFSNAGMDAQKAYKSLEIAANKYHTLKEAAQYFMKMRKPRVFRYLDSVKQNKLLFESHFENLKHYESIFYGIEKNIPKVILIDFIVTSKVNEPIKIKDSIAYYLYNVPGQGQIIMLGEHAAVDSLIRAGILANNSIINAIQIMLAKQAELTPKTVASPFEIFTLTKGGVEWNFNPLHCN